MTEQQRPNVLWLMSDQHHAQCMGHAGRAVRTPTLDWLASAGVRFSQAFCNNPICAPSRLSFITGQYPRTHRHLGNNIFEYPEGNPNTLSALARRYGYQTALVGKGHMIRAWDEEGFEHRRYCDLIDADRSDPTSHAYFRYLAEHGLADAYDYGRLPAEHPGARTHRFIGAIPHEHALEVWTGNETLAFLQNRDRRRPFFIQMSFQRPHEPLSLCPACAGMYAPEAVQVPSSARDFFERQFAGKPLFQREYIANRGTYPYVPADMDDLRLQLAFYYALITNMDTQIGRVLNYLCDCGELDNTIVVYVADHGDFAGDHGLTQKNLGIYESIHRIPFLLRYPGGPQGRIVDALVESVDLYPTLAALMEVPVPATVEGQSLLAVIDAESSGKDAVICEWSWLEPVPLIYAIRTPRYRLVYYGSTMSGELYDRQSDPDELVNLYDDPMLAGVRLSLTERLLDHVMRYERRSDLMRDASEDARTRTMPTRLLQVGKRKWSEIEQFFAPR